jgi:futalosine hydrolase
MSVLVLAATPFEAAMLGDIPAAVIVTGMGAVNTAHALTRFLSTRDQPSLVIQAGVAGAYVPTGITVGSVVLATGEMYGDVGIITPEGWLPSDAIGIPLVEATSAHPARYNEFPSDPEMVARASSVCGPLIARTGRFLTLAQVTGVQAIGDALHHRFNAICESMEGAAAAQVCAMHDIPFLEVRGVSNLVTDRDRAAWRVAEASEAAQHVVRHLAGHAGILLAGRESPSHGMLR